MEGVFSIKKITNNFQKKNLFQKYCVELERLITIIFLTERFLKLLSILGKKL